MGSWEDKNQFPRVFENYILIDRRGAGGMAEVFRAVTKDDIARLVVIKQSLAHLQTEPEFRRMFVDEIKITALLNHPNIVHVNSYGQKGEFIELEYVHGKTIKDLWRELKSKGQSIPIHVAIYIAHEVAKGLSYAHSLKDKISGEPLNIIHRDVSPQNIILGYNGEVKILDFGIAKIVGKLEHTQIGAFKGKPFYMSPEQITNPNKINHRSDIFSLGVVLWNMLTNQKLFDAESQDQYLLELRKFEFEPPKNINKDISDNLNNIVMRALQEQPENRFANMEALREELYVESLKSHSPYSLTKNVKEWMQNHFAEDFKGEKEKLRGLLAEAQTFQKNIDDPDTIILQNEEGKKQDSANQPLPTAASTAFKTLTMPTYTLAAVLLVFTVLFAHATLFKSSGFFASINKAERSPASDSPSLNELKALIQQSSWQEALILAKKIPPLERNKAWQTLVETSAIKQASQITGIELSQSDQLMQDFPTLKSSSNYLDARSDLIEKIFAECAKQGKSDCIQQVIKLEKKAPLKRKSFYNMGMESTYNFLPRFAVPLFEKVLDKKTDPKLCMNERVELSITTSLESLPYLDESNRFPTQKIIAFHCYSQFKNMVIKKVQNPYSNEAFCKIFVMAKDKRSHKKYCSK